MADSTSSQYDQESKKECRSKLIEHAVRCLTTERSTSVCVKRDHVARVWKQLHESGEAYEYFTEEDRQEIEEAIGNWELFHDSQVQTRKPSDLRVCYLGGDNPINDLEVLVANGVLCQNVWAIEKDAKTLEKAWNAIKNSQLRNVRLFKGDILTFLKDFRGQFDIIYFDACGTLPAAKQNTLKVIGYVFLYDKLMSPGALITNFSFPPQDTQQESPSNSQHVDEEKEMINFLVKECMRYRLCNVKWGETWPENNEDDLSDWTDEDKYGDYISYQVIDSAYLFIPAQRMLLSEGKSLWGQMFHEKKHFLKRINNSYCSSANVEGMAKGTNEQSTKTTQNQELLTNALKEMEVDGKSTTEKCKNKFKELQKKLKAVHLSNILSSDLKRMAETFLENSDNRWCEAWVDEIFPDWIPEKSLDKEEEKKREEKRKEKRKEIPTMLLTPQLISSPMHIICFSNVDFVSKCLGPLFNAVCQEKFPFCCDVTATFEQATCLVAGLLYGQLAYPSFPVVDKLFRLRYTAKKRQMFADVFVFDKCRYLYEQFPTVDCACFAIVEPKQQIVFRMVVDGLCKHLGGICSEDLFNFCNVASKDAIVEGGVSFPNSERSIPDRQEIEQYVLLKEKAFGLVKVKEYKEALEIYHECLSSCPVSLQDTILANISLGLFENES
ncbi:uncharacterized protein LOC114971682 [Acropora millepora]|uniref:uncharacterized protein LOC114971682 n=1 Tax=Acropora millepora TaxID=45264 RepID=UPI001CF198E9|nr:uncharacterized protein LOC114971682 [Acropora millepora]